MVEELRLKKHATLNKAKKIVNLHYWRSRTWKFSKQGFEALQNEGLLKVPAGLRLDVFPSPTFTRWFSLGIEFIGENLVRWFSILSQKVI